MLAGTYWDRVLSNLDSTVPFLHGPTPLSRPVRSFARGSVLKASAGSRQPAIFSACCLLGRFYSAVVQGS
eukprot:SAG11_NODE_192_length_12931_cov_5.747682_6_plen_70_part_00